MRRILAPAPNPLRNDPLRGFRAEALGLSYGMRRILVPTPTLVGGRVRAKDARLGARAVLNARGFGP